VRYLHWATMLITSIIHLIISIAFNNVNNSSIIYSRTSQLIIVYCVYLVNKIFYLPILVKGVSMFNGILKINIVSGIFSLFILIVTFFILFLTSFYIITLKNKNLKSITVNKLGQHYKITEYTLLLLFIISGSIFLVFSNDLIMLFLAIELQSYGLYLICTLYKDSENSTKAGLTYFLLGGLSSCIILLGFALLYINFGSTNLENISMLYDLYNKSNLEEFFYSNSNYNIHLILAVLSIGFLFKISAAPFHFWSPDVYDNIPTVVTTFVAIIGKISILIILLEFCILFSNDYENVSWINNILISSSLSLIIGTILGLTQSRIKRLYAYSTISHVGFMLLALSINSSESIQAFIFYLIQYSVSNLNAFFILIGIGYYLHNYNNVNEQSNRLNDKTNSPIQLIAQLKGLSESNPLLCLSLTITILSFLGIPPLIGFFGKQMVLSASLDEGYVFMSFIIIITSVIGGVYYLAIIKEMYFYKPEHGLSNTNESFYKNKLEKFELSNTISLVISIITFLIIIYMLTPEIVLNLLNLVIIN
jgi:NADH-ubiquinone oxidoreductase chain 2